MVPTSSLLGRASCLCYIWDFDILDFILWAYPYFFQDITPNEELVINFLEDAQLCLRGNVTTIAKAKALVKPSFGPAMPAEPAICLMCSHVFDAIALEPRKTCDCHFGWHACVLPLSLRGRASLGCGESFLAVEIGAGPMTLEAIAGRPDLSTPTRHPPIKGERLIPMRPRHPEGQGRRRSRSKRAPQKHRTRHRVFVEHSFFRTHCISDTWCEGHSCRTWEF